jgi:tetratricopeptide (TPR) repeat protein
MRTFIRLFYAVMVILAATSFGCSKNEACRGSSEKSGRGFKMKRGLDDALRVECDLLADSLLSREESSVDDSFAAAQFANVCERPEEAIRILEDAISKEGDKQVNLLLGWHIPVKILGHLWIGTTAKQAGDIAKAKYAYETSLKKLEDMEIVGEERLAAICHIYLAEIEAKYLKRQDRALRHLRAIGHIERPNGKEIDLYENWAAYEHTRISEGKDHAAQQLSCSGFERPLDLYIHLAVSGVMGELGEYVGPAKQELFAKVIWDRAMVRTRGWGDTNMLRLAYGFNCEQTENFNEAEKHYSAVFEDESYFSPLGGIFLAGCKRRQGKIADAEEILEKVAAKHPGCESLVTKLFKKTKQDP